MKTSRPPFSLPGTAGMMLNLTGSGIHPSGAAETTISPFYYRCIFIDINYTVQVQVKMQRIFLPIYYLFKKINWLYLSIQRLSGQNLVSRRPDGGKNLGFREWGHEGHSSRMPPYLKTWRRAWRRGSRVGIITFIVFHTVFEYKQSKKNHFDTLLVN